MSKKSCSFAVLKFLLINGKTLNRTLPNCRKNGNTAEPPAVSCRFAVLRGFHTKKSCSFGILLINGKTFYRTLPNCRKNGNTAEPPAVSCRFAVLMGLHTRQKKLQFCSIAVFTDKRQNLLPHPAELPKKRNTAEPPALSFRFAVFRGLHTRQKKVAFLQYCSFY